MATSTPMVDSLLSELVALVVERNWLQDEVNKLKSESVNAKGEDRPNRRKLDAEEVELIREMARKGIPQVDIARSFDVNPATISRIVRGIYHR